MKKINDFIERIFNYLIFIAFLLVSFFVLVQVITRYTPGISAPWTDELTRLAFLYSVMVGAPMAIKHDEYAVIDVVTERLKGRSSHIMKIVINIIIAIFSFVGTQQGIIFYQAGLRSVSTSLKINLGVFYFVTIGIFALTFVYCVIGILEEIIKLKKEEN